MSDSISVKLFSHTDNFNERNFPDWFYCDPQVGDLIECLPEKEHVILEKGGHTVLEVGARRWRAEGATFRSQLELALIVPGTSVIYFKKV